MTVAVNKIAFPVSGVVGARTSVTMASTQQIMNQFISGLKNRNEETRLKAANDLFHFVTNELRELPQAEITFFLDDFNHHVFEMVSSSDMNERKGGILTIGSYLTFLIRL